MKSFWLVAVFAMAALGVLAVRIVSESDEPRRPTQYGGYQILETGPPEPTIWASHTLDIEVHNPPGNAFPFTPPTPTPTPVPPTPTPEPVYVAPEPTPEPYVPPAPTYGGGDVVSLIYALFPAEMAPTWERIARCESGLNPWAVGGAGERGIFQIHPIHAGGAVAAAGYSWDAMFDPYANMIVALALSGGGWNTGPWSCAR